MPRQDIYYRPQYAAAFSAFNPAKIAGNTLVEILGESTDQGVEVQTASLAGGEIAGYAPIGSDAGGCLQVVKAGCFCVELSVGPVALGDDLISAGDGTAAPATGAIGEFVIGKAMNAAAVGESVSFLFDQEENEA